MRIILISIGLSTIILFIIFFLVKRKKKNFKKNQDEIDPTVLKNWKQERRKNLNTRKLDVSSMGDNIAKSHALWKNLSKIVHESKWVDYSIDKIKLAAEFNVLINENKGNYNELQNLEKRINEELLNN